MRKCFPVVHWLFWAYRSCDTVWAQNLQTMHPFYVLPCSGFLLSKPQESGS